MHCDAMPKLGAELELETITELEMMVMVMMMWGESRLQDSIDLIE